MKTGTPKSRGRNLFSLANWTAVVMIKPHPMPRIIQPSTSVDNLFATMPALSEVKSMQYLKAAAATAHPRMLPKRIGKRAKNSFLLEKKPAVPVYSLSL